jgi:hypothetical protein
MNRRRTAAVAGVAALGAFALTGCGLSKPSALATVVSGTNSAHTEARCKNVGADEAKATACISPETAGLKKPTVLKVSEGAEVGVGVDTSVKDHSWQVVIGDKAGPVITGKTFYQGFRVPIGTFEADESGSKTTSLPLAVVEYGKDQTANKIWLFSLEKK